MAIDPRIRRALSRPTPEAVWELRTQLLEREVPVDARVWAVAREFHDFLDRLATGTSSRDFSHLASKLDIAAIGGVLLEQLLEPENTREVCLRLFSGMISEGLMVLATRQHVKAWSGELVAVHRGASWYLYGELWRWATELNPALPPGERRRLIDRLVSPLRAEGGDSYAKALLAGLLFEMLLVSYLAREVPGLVSSAAPSR